MLLLDTLYEIWGKDNQLNIELDANHTNPTGWTASDYFDNMDGAVKKALEYYEKKL